MGMCTSETETVESKSNHEFGDSEVGANKGKCSELAESIYMEQVHGTQCFFFVIQPLTATWVALVFVSLETSSCGYSEGHKIESIIFETEFLL